MKKYPSDLIRSEAMIRKNKLLDPKKVIRKNEDYNVNNLGQKIILLELPRMELSTNTSLADLVGPSSSGTFLALTGSGILFELTVLKAIVLIAGSIQTKGSLSM